MTDGKERANGRAGSDSPLPTCFTLVGFAGCLQFFTATFRGDVEEVELAVNRLYRGT